MKDLRKLKDKAAELATKGKLEKAAELYREAAAADPKDVGTRQKLAEVLRRSGRIRDAVQAYREVADRFANDGLLIKAIAISKTILELDPQHVETQTALAELYAQRAAVEGTRPPPRTQLMSAMRAVAAPAPPAAPPPAPGGDEGAVAIELGPPPPDEGEAVPLDDLLVDSAPEGIVPAPREPARPAGSRPQPGFEAATPLARIVLAADAAVEAGIVEDVVVEPDAVELDVAEDEPLELAAPSSAAALEPAGPDEPATPLEILVEPEEAPPPAPAPRAAPPPPPARAASPAAAPPSPRVPPPGPAPGRAPPPAARAPALPRVPIFSDLSREAFVELTRRMVLHRVPEGEAVIREGDDGTSFYVVASGRLAVSKRADAGGSIVLAHLGEGDFFGEMALLAGTPRSASVTAEEDAQVLELPADVLLDIAGRHPHLAQSLRRFYRQRLLANAMALSPLFRPFQRADRKVIMGRFRAREVAAGEVVIREGERSDGLYVVLEGAVDVVKRGEAGAEVAVGHLREGDLFGEISCLRKAPASASVVVRRPGTLLRLPRAEFDDLVVTYPQILELVADLSEERSEHLDAILSGHAEWTDDGLVLT